MKIRGGIFSLINLGIFIAKRISGTSGAGRRGERAVSWRLDWLPNDYLIINDLLFHIEKGRTTQIDHVVVSRYGIFVIETKNYSGYIYGSENAREWKKYWKAWYYGVEHSDELTFPNPVQQNKAHIDALKKALSNYPHARYVSIIAFSTNAELKVQVEHANVMYWSQVRGFIRQHKTPIMSSEEAQQIYEYLLAINVKGKDAREKHAARALLSRTNYEERVKEAAEQGKCPQCGGQLVLRNGRNGEFYGCSNYPNCKYTHPAYN